MNCATRIRPLTRLTIVLMSLIVGATIGALSLVPTLDRVVGELRHYEAALERCEEWGR